MATIAPSGGAWILRSDQPIGDAQRKLANVVRSADQVIEDWTMHHIRRMDVYIVESERFDKVRGSRNCSAMTVTRGRGHPSIVVQCPQKGATSDATELLRQFACFQLAHECLHAAIPQRTITFDDSEEALANFIASRTHDETRVCDASTLSVADTAPRADGVPRADGALRAAVGFSLLLRTIDGKPLTIDAALRAKEAEAYTLGWVGLEYAASFIGKQTYHQWAEWTLAQNGFVTTAMVNNKLKELCDVQSSVTSVTSASASTPSLPSFPAFVEELAERLDLWCVPLDLGPHGSRPDGTFVAVGCDTELVVILDDDPAAQRPLEGAVHDRESPSIRRVRAIEIINPAATLAWVAVREGNYPALALLDLSAAKRRQFISENRFLDISTLNEVSQGGCVRLETDGCDVLLRMPDGREVCRWQGAARTLFVLKLVGAKKASVVPTWELRPVLDLHTNHGPLRANNDETLPYAPDTMGKQESQSWQKTQRIPSIRLQAFLEPLAGASATAKNCASSRRRTVAPSP